MVHLELLVSHIWVLILDESHKECWEMFPEKILNEALEEFVRQSMEQFVEKNVKESLEESRRNSWKKP